MTIKAKQAQLNITEITCSIRYYRNNKIQWKLITCDIDSKIYIDDADICHIYNNDIKVKHIKMPPPTYFKETYTEKDMKYFSDAITKVVSQMLSGEHIIKNNDFYSIDIKNEELCKKEIKLNNNQTWVNILYRTKEVIWYPAYPITKDIEVFKMNDEGYYLF